MLPRFGLVLASMIHCGENMHFIVTGLRRMRTRGTDQRQTPAWRQPSAKLSPSQSGLQTHELENEIPFIVSH